MVENYNPTFGFLVTAVRAWGFHARTRSRVFLMPARVFVCPLFPRDQINKPMPSWLPTSVPFNFSVGLFIVWEKWSGMETSCPYTAESYLSATFGPNYSFNSFWTRFQFLTHMSTAGKHSRGVTNYNKATIPLPKCLAAILKFLGDTFSGEETIVHSSGAVSEWMPSLYYIHSTYICIYFRTVSS